MTIKEKINLPDTHRCDVCNKPLDSDDTTIDDSMCSTCREDLNQEIIIDYRESEFSDDYH